MVAVFAALMLQSVFPDRQAFNRALGKVREDMTPAQVERLIGKPDDIWTPADSSLYVDADEVVWAYGTDGHLSLPTLGKVVFQDGKVIYGTGDDWRPQIPNLPPEVELRKHLRAIYVPPMRGHDYDPLATIRAVNDLLPLGKEEALAVMKQYERLGPPWGEGNRLFWIAFALFESKKPFPLPRIGSISPEPPKDARSWPTFPILLVDDVPFSFYRGVSLAGYPEPFERYVQRAAKDWTIRTESLRPPNDPFPDYKKAVQFVRSNFPAMIDDTTPSHDGAQFGSLLQMVREVYPTPYTYFQISSTEAIEKAHQTFLKTGAMWSEARQRYVRADGSWTPIHILHYPVLSEKLNVDGWHIRVSVERMEEADGANVSYRITSLDDAPKSRVAHYRFVEARTGKQVSDARAGEFTGGSASSGFDLPTGIPIQFVLIVDGKEHRSGVFQP